MVSDPLCQKAFPYLCFVFYSILFFFFLKGVANNTRATLKIIKTFVHIIHNGEPVETGANLPNWRIRYKAMFNTSGVLFSTF